MMKKLLAAAAFCLVAGTASADCSFQNTTPVKLSAAAFEAWKAVSAAMEECGNVSAELSQEFQDKQSAGMAARPSLYSLGGVANSSLVPLLNEKLVRPLDDLIAKHGQNLTPAQQIKVDGQTVAIAMMANAQHLMYRTDILAELGIAVPTTYEELLAAAEKIKAAGVVDYPFGGSWKTTWLEFVNMYLGYGGSFFTDGVRPAVNNETGIKALEMMKAVAGYMDPEYLVSDSTYVQRQMQDGKIAIAVLWASRAGAMNDPEQSRVAGKVAFASALAPEEGMIPAATLWWDGVVVASNISDDEAEAAFRVAMEGIDAQMAEANPKAAIWMVKGYQPGETAAGAVATAQNGAKPYPASLHMGLMQKAIEKNISGYLTGATNAARTLAAMEADYLLSAEEIGILK